jgi:hypothetical protein
MPQLHETLIGRKFFESDLPRLIRAIENLAKAIEERSDSVTVEKESTDQTPMY